MVQLDPGSLGPVTNRLKRAQGQLTAVVRMLEGGQAVRGRRHPARRGQQGPGPGRVRHRGHRPETVPSPRRRCRES
jgi:hypothetical protein